MPSLVISGLDGMFVSPGRFFGKSCLLVEFISTLWYVLQGVRPQAVFYGGVTCSGGVCRWSGWLPASSPRTFYVVLVGDSGVVLCFFVAFIFLGHVWYSKPIPCCDSLEA